MSHIPPFDEGKIAWVLTERDLASLVLAIEQSHEVVLDLETTGLDEHAYRGGPSNGGVAARIVMASFTLPRSSDDMHPTTWVIGLSHPDSTWCLRWQDALADCVRAIVRGRKPVIGQNIKFDARWVYAHTGIDLADRIAWDTKVSSHLLDENTTTSLKPRASETFQIARWDDFSLKEPGAAERVPFFDLGAYAARDTYYTWALAQVHRSLMFLDPDDDDAPLGVDEIEHARLGRLAVHCAMPSVATLTRIEQRGMRMDRAWVERELSEHEEKADSLHESLVKRYPDSGLDPADASFAPTSHWFRSWTEHAVGAGDLAIQERTAKGAAKWTKSVLTRQARNGSEVALDLLALRSHRKKSEFLRSWLGSCSRDDMIHTTYNAGTVVTGRLSSSNPNMQQVTKSLRPAFVPSSPDYVMADFDYSQIELRVAAYIGRIEPMLEALRNGDDLHTLLAARITDKRIIDVTRDERQAGKSANFGLLYGMSPAGFRLYSESVYGITFTQDEAEAIHRAYFETWTGMREWHNRMIARAQQEGSVRSPIGRVRRVAESRGIEDGYQERAAINAPVQGFASDLLQIAAAAIEGLLPMQSGPAVPDARIVGTVHDSLVVELPRHDWERVAAQVAREMIGVNKHLEHFGVQLDVPLDVEATVGHRWGLDDIGSLVIH